MHHAIGTLLTVNPGDSVGHCCKDMMKSNASTAHRTARWTKFLYTMAAPSIRASKWPQLRQSIQDFGQNVGKTFRAEEASRRAGPRANEEAPGSSNRLKATNKAFRTAQTLLPDNVQELFREENLKKCYKKAGTESNQRASAATAWLLQNAGSWDRSTSAWTGRAMGGSYFHGQASVHHRQSHVPQPHHD